METNEGQHRTPSGKMLFLPAFKQNWDVIGQIERTIANVQYKNPSGGSLLHVDEDRQT
jgi:hypothetical protein